MSAVHEQVENGEKARWLLFAVFAGIAKRCMGMGEGEGEEPAMVGP